MPAKNSLTGRPRPQFPTNVPQVGETGGLRSWVEARQKGEMTGDEPLNTGKELEARRTWPEVTKKWENQLPGPGRVHRGRAVEPSPQRTQVIGR